jgi:hypothetical protein
VTRPQNKGSSPAASGLSLWTVTIDVFSPEPSLCAVWEKLDKPDDLPSSGLLPGLEGHPAGRYFDERDVVHAWLALRLRAHEAAGARQRGQDFVDRILSCAPGEVARHRRLRVEVSAVPARERSWDREKWLLAPRTADCLPRPVPWSACQPSADGLKLTIVWTSPAKQVERVDVAEDPDRVRITVHERRPPLLTPGGAISVSRVAKKPRQATVQLKRPLARREVCDGFDGLPRRIVPRG